MEMLKIPNLKIVPAKGEEQAHPELSPAELVKELSRCKAREVAAACAGPEDTVVGADTVVALDGAVLGKPKDPADACRMLRALSGRAHLVYTGVTVIRGGTELCRAEETAVHFRPLSEEEIERYVATGEGVGPVGALSTALKLALRDAYPQVLDMHLIDFKVRLLDESTGTDAITRVVITTRDEAGTWGTIGVSENIIEASWNALVDSIEYGLVRGERIVQGAQSPSKG